MGYLKERFIGENIRTIDDIMSYTNLKQLSGYILLVDFEKAFDSIEWSFWNFSTLGKILLDGSKYFTQKLKHVYQTIVIYQKYFSYKEGYIKVAQFPLY